MHFYRLLLSSLFLSNILSFNISSPVFSIPLLGGTPANFSFAEVVKKTAPAVVNLLVLQVVDADFVHPFVNDPDFRFFFEFGILGVPSPKPHRSIERSLGSGVLVDPSGIILTCFHVVHQAKSIRVELNDNRKYEAAIVITDPENDLAVLKIKNLPKKETLPFVTLGDSDLSQVGDALLVIGNAFGMKQSVTAGINSANNKMIGDEKLVIQTDASINPGNSGGGIFREDKLIAIPNAIYSKTGASHGINFGIPVIFANSLINAAKNGRKLVRPWSGVKTQTVTPELAESMKLPYLQGALVTSIHEHSPLQPLLRSSDVVLEVNGVPISSSKHFELRLKAFEISEKVTLKIWRYGTKESQEKEITFMTITPPKDDDSKRFTFKATPLSGVTVANNSVSLAAPYKADPAIEGVIITQIKPHPYSFAAHMSPLLKVGDIILKVDEERVRTVVEIQSRTQKKRSFSLVLRRGKRDLKIS